MIGSGHAEHQRISAPASLPLAHLLPVAEPMDWPRVEFGSVCVACKDAVEPSAERSLRYVGLEHIESGNPILGRWASSDDVVSTKWRFRTGDVLYGKLRPYLDKAAVAPFDGMCSTDILVLSAGPRLDRGYLSYLAHSAAFREHAVRTSAGVNHPRTSWHALSAFDFTLPSLDVQRAIADTLGTVQAAIQARRREIALERERKAALMQHLFTKGTRGEPTKMTELGEMPEGWRVVRLGDIAAVAYGLTVNGRRRSAPDLRPYLTVANVERGTLDLGEVKKIGILPGDEERFALRDGDVLLIEGNGNPQLLGSAAVWRDEIPGALHQNHLIRVRSEGGVLLSDWIMEYVNSDGGRRQLLGMGKTSSGLHSINSSLVASLRLPAPPLPEQCAVVRAARITSTTRECNAVELRLLSDLFRTLLERVMAAPGARAAGAAP